MVASARSRCGVGGHQPARPESAQYEDVALP
ncbi:hypothetical protein ACWEPM_23995 [Streptomyces sp. NPDC004244]